MTIRYGDRNQMTMLPPSIEEYVSSDEPVRAYDAFVEALDMEQLGIKIEENKVGNPNYDPEAMLKLLVYGYSYGHRSSRKLERATYHNISFIWLMGGLKPDHKTIANFRKNNKDSLKKVLKQCARLCIDLNLIEGNTLFIDGSKIRANASINRTMTKEKCEKEMIWIEKRIEEILNESEKIDNEESGTWVKIEEELRDKEVLRERIKSVLKKIKDEEKKSINITDEECTMVKGRQGTHAGYNGQIVVDEKNGLIVSSDVTNESNDLNQFTKQVEQANEVLGKDCRAACADSGYSDTEDLKQTVDKGIEVIVPSQKQAMHNAKDNPFEKDKFQYNEKEDEYICPEGKVLKYSHYSKTKGHYLYRMKGAKNCKNCKYYGKCTNNKRGRIITRLKNEEVKQNLEAIYSSGEGQAIYKKRKEKVELPFGHMKRNLNAGAFLLRGLQGVKAEMALLSTCFNIRRMITILGMEQLMQKLYVKKMGMRLQEV